MQLTSENLYEYIISRPRPDRELQIRNEKKVIKDIAKQIAESILFLHQQKIILRDLDAFNIIMTNKTDKARPRISNMKNVEILDPETTTADLIGDLRFRAPETFNHDLYFVRDDSRQNNTGPE